MEEDRRGNGAEWHYQCGTLPLIDNYDCASKAMRVKGEVLSLFGGSCNGTIKDNK